MNEFNKPPKELNWYLSWLLHLMSTVLHKTIGNQIFWAKLHFNFIVTVLKMLQKIKGFVNIFLSIIVFFAVYLGFVDAINQFWNYLSQLIRHIFSYKNKRKFSLGRQHTLHFLIKMQKENINSREDQCFVFFVIISLQELAQYFVTFTSKNHHNGFIWKNICLLDEVSNFNFDLFWSDIMHHKRVHLSFRTVDISWEFFKWRQQPRQANEFVVLRNIITYLIE